MFIQEGNLGKNQIATMYVLLEILFYLKYIILMALYRLFCFLQFAIIIKFPTLLLPSNFYPLLGV